MRALTVYECNFCKELFRTSNKHKCKFDPKMKNCFTCANFVKFEEQNYDDSYGGFTYPVCTLEAKDTDLKEMSQLCWNLDCHKWELRAGYVGKQSYSDYCEARDRERERARINN